MIALETFDNFIDVPQKSNEWYTPSRYIEAARMVMGSIDLDPASCALANRTIKADRYYTIEENGLSKPWYGCVWLNPPYGRTYKNTGTTAFVTRLIEEYTKGSVEQAIILTMVGMYANWFFQLLDYPLCYLKAKPVFTLPDGTKGKHAFAACCTYLGPHETKFIDVFSQFGIVAKRVSQPKQAVTPLRLWEGH